MLFSSVFRSTPKDYMNTDVGVPGIAKDVATEANTIPTNEAAKLYTKRPPRRLLRRSTKRPVKLMMTFLLQDRLVLSRSHGH